MKILIMFFLMCGVCFAQVSTSKDFSSISKEEWKNVKVRDKNNVEWRQIKEDDFIGVGKEAKLKPEYTVEKFSTELNASGYYEKLAKPNIQENVLLTEEQSKAVKVALWNTGLVDDNTKKVKEGRKLIFRELMPAKNDYKHDFDRGTVHYTPKNRNYSFSKVIIPDGTVIRNSNFTQKKANTEAIVGDNLTFIDCNLVNVKRNPTWIIESSNNCQIERKIKEQKDNHDGTTTLVIAHKVFNDKKKEFEEVATDEEVVINNELNNKLLYFQP